MLRTFCCGEKTDWSTFSKDEVRHDINYMLLLCIFLFCTGLSLKSKPEQSLKEQQGDRGAARMARRRIWLLFGRILCRVYKIPKFKEDFLKFYHRFLE